MRFCNSHGIPHSEYLDWDAEDQAKAMAYQFEDAQRCQMCGTADWEWEENKRAYEPVMTTCWGCYYKDIAREGQNIGPGVTVSLEKPGTMAAAKREVLERRLAQRQRAARRREAEKT
jgi:hypothetical protein